MPEIEMWRCVSLRIPALKSGECKTRLEFRRKMEITFVFVVWVSGGQSGASTAVRVALGNSTYTYMYTHIT